MKLAPDGLYFDHHIGNRIGRLGKINYVLPSFIKNIFPMKIATDQPVLYKIQQFNMLGSL